MRIAHISDLHLGKTLYGFSLTDDQSFILSQIAQILKEKKIDVLLVAGDVYDKSIASVEAINVFREFLNAVVSLNIHILIVSGNHDSPERLTFGSEFMSSNGIYFSKLYDGVIEPVTIKDTFGPVHFYLVPFLKPAVVKHVFPDEKIETYNDAVKTALSRLNVNYAERNVIVAHQNIMSAEHCESEETVIGGLDAVSADLFSAFDYVALGHLHKMQNIKPNVHFSGTPLKYSVSELNNEKTLSIIELNEKGNIGFDAIPLKPKRDIRQIRGTFSQIVQMSANDTNNPEDFIDIILTDENEILDAIDTLRSIYPNILKITYDNSSTQNSAKLEDLKTSKIEKPAALFEEFYKNRSGSELDENQKKYITVLIDSIWENNQGN